MREFIIENINLKDSIESGQYFNWDKIADNKYILVIDSLLLLAIKNKGDNLSWKLKLINDKNAYPKIQLTLENFFNTNINLDLIHQKINKDQFISEAINKHYGMRVFNQDYFETLISFIISAFNNIS